MGTGRLSLTKERWNTIKEFVQEPLGLFDGKTGRALDVNQEFCARFCVTDEEATKLLFGDISSGEQSYTRDDASTRFAEVARTGNCTVNWHCKNSSGAAFWAELTMRSAVWNRHACVTVQIHDIKAWKSSHDLRLQNVSLHNALIANAPFGFYVLQATDDGMRFLHVSDRWCEISGLRREDVLLDASIAFAGIAEDRRDEVVRLNEEAIRSNSVFRWTGPAMARGELHWVQIESYPTVADDGTALWVGIVLDVSEQHQLQEALQRQIVALTRPITEDTSVRFEDMFRLSDIQEIQDLFARATGVASVVARPDGTPITTPSNSSRLCYGVIRKTAQGLKNCFHSDAVLGRHHPSGPVVQPCLGCGLWDAGASITVGGHHVANWMIGQVRNETQTEEHMREYAREIGADEEQLVEAFREVPTMSRERFNDIAHALFAFANHLSTTAYQNIQQARFIAERKQAEDALRKSEERFRGITQNLPGIVFQFYADADGKIGVDYLSRSSLLSFGIDSKDREGLVDRFAAGLAEADRSRFFSSIKEAVRTASPWKYEGTYRKPDGTTISLLGVSQPRELEQKLVFDGLLLDVSKQKQAEEKYTLVLKTLMDGYVLLDQNGIILDVNGAYCRIIGYSREELLSMHLSDVTVAYSPDQIRTELAKVGVNGFDRFETVHRRRDGTRIDLEASIQNLPENNQFFVIYRDITEQNRAKKEFERLAKLQQTILDTITTGVTLVKHRKLVWTNRAFCTLFGYEPDELISAENSLFYATNEEYKRVGREGYPELARGDVFSTESLMRRKDGTLRWFRLVGKALIPSDDSEGSIWMLLDIDERKKAEQKLKRSEAVLHATIEAMNEGVLVVTADGFVSQANSRFREIFHIPDSIFNTGDDNMLLQHAMTQVADPEGFRRRVHEICGTTESTEDTVLTADGRILDRFSYPLQKDSPVQGRVWLFRDVTERRRTEAALTRSEALLRESQRVAHIGSWELDLSTRSLHWNEESYRLHGVPNDASPVTFDTFLSLVVPADRADVVQHLEESVEMKAFKELECRIIRGDGQQRNVFIAGAVKTDEAGDPGSMLGIIQDITELKRAEERYKTIIHTAMDGFVLHDASGRILEVNDALCQLTGQSRTELLGRNIGEFQVEIRPSSFLSDTLKEVARMGSARLENRNQRKDGRIADVEVSITCMHQEEDLFFVFLRDITEQKAAAKALNESQERLQSFMNSATDGFTIWDENLRLIEMNSASLHYLPEATTKEDLLGMPIHNMIPNDEAGNELRHLHHVLETGIPCSEGHLLHLMGRWHLLRAFPVGKGLGIVSSDITERKNAEDTLRLMNEELEHRVAERTEELQRANKEMESFAYSVSHDLRAPLRAIDGYTRILIEDYAQALDENGMRVCGIVRDETRRMGQLVDDILALSRLGRAVLEEGQVDLAELTRSVLDEQLTAEQRERITVTTTPLPTVHGDQRLLRQALINLVSNAVKFSSKQEHPHVEIGTAEQNGETVFFVRDNGAGFDMQYAAKLFGVFQRLHTEREFPGTGVGLAIVQRIITRHGGRVWAEAEVGKGATFYFTLSHKGTST